MTTLTTRDQFGLSKSRQLALLLISSILLWTIGAPALLNHANAAFNLTSVSDTLTSSNLSTNAGHTIQFTATASIQPSQTIKIGLDPDTNLFTEAFSSATSTDFGFYVGGSKYSIVTSCTAGSQVTAAATYNNGSDENLTFTVCSTAPAIATSSVITIGVATSTSATKVWTNPATPGSYRIVITGTNPNTGETRVAILQNVTVTASVNTSFTFTVSGLATSTNVNGDSTTHTSTATALPFETLASGTPQILAQQLNVSTNARNGFSVTVQEDQPPTSATGATIDLFANGATSSQPRPWIAPSAILDVPSTYGHFGITSDDADEGGGEFVATTTTPYVGNFDQPRVIFTHNGPSDGTTQNKGLAKVGFKMQISDLQEAGSDYTDTITYVATPTF